MVNATSASPASILSMIPSVRMSGSGRLSSREKRPALLADSQREFWETLLRLLPLIGATEVLDEYQPDFGDDA